MNIFTIIKKDHDEGRTLMNEILSTADIYTRKRLFQELKVAILSHAKSEEETFYKSLRKSGDKEMKQEVPHFKEEHKTVEKLFEEIEALSLQDYMWWEKFGELRQALLHHMKEEEKEVFPEAKKEIPKKEAKDLGIQMEDLEENKKEELIRKEVA